LIREILLGMGQPSRLRTGKGTLLAVL